MYKEFFCHTNDVAINIASREKNENDISILFVHGFLERWQSWQKIMDNIPSHYNIYSVDLRGFGRSGKTPVSYTHLRAHET